MEWIQGSLLSWESFGRIADILSVLGFLIVILNSWLLLRYGRKMWFSINYEKIAGRIKEHREYLGSNLAASMNNLPELLGRLKKLEVDVYSIKFFIDKPGRRHVADILSCTKRVAGFRSPSSSLDVIDRELLTMYTALHGFEAALEVQAEQRRTQQ